MPSRRATTLALLLAACGDPAPAPVPPVAPPHPEQPPHPAPPLGPDAGPGPDPIAMGSGGAFQDPMGFPDFHAHPAPPGPAIEALGDWTPPVRLSEGPGGGYRPQVTVAPDGTIHAVYYERDEAGDLLRHRHSTDGRSWSAPAHLGFDEHRNWGPDLIALGDGSLVVVFDHALPDLTSRGYLTRWRDGVWSAPTPLTPDDGGEVGSGHVAEAAPGELLYVWIGRPVQGREPFRAWSAWYRDGRWLAPEPLSDGSTDAWHTNVESRGDGSVMLAFDLGRGGSETTLYAAEARGGAIAALEDISATSHPGERAHFAFGPDATDHITWFHKQGGSPVHVYVRAGGPGRWGPPEEPSAGWGGYHFDPEIAVNTAGTRCLVWGWDEGAEAELVYSLDAGQGWSPPRRVASLGAGKPGLASLVAGPDGRFHVVWNQGVRGSNDVYYAALDAR